MIIADQLTLFFSKIRDAQGNSSLTPEQALAYINASRKSVAAETKFYDVKDKITAVGGETYFTLLDSFINLQAARDCVTRNGYPVVIKTLAEWASITNGTVLQAVGITETWGMLHGNTFYIYPAAEASDAFVWWGAAEPPDLPDITGADVYLNNRQARATVLDAAEQALEDLGERPGELLDREVKRLKILITPPRGPRLENAPEE